MIHREQTCLRCSRSTDWNWLSLCDECRVWLEGATAEHLPALHHAMEATHGADLDDWIRTGRIEGAHWFVPADQRQQAIDTLRDALCGHSYSLLGAYVDNWPIFFGFEKRLGGAAGPTMDEDDFDRALRVALDNDVVGTILDRMVEHLPTEQQQRELIHEGTRPLSPEATQGGPWSEEASQSTNAHEVISYVLPHPLIVLVNLRQSMGWQYSGDDLSEYSELEPWTWFPEVLPEDMRITVLRCWEWGRIEAGKEPPAE